MTKGTCDSGDIRRQLSVLFRRRALYLEVILASGCRYHTKRAAYLCVTVGDALVVLLDIVEPSTYARTRSSHKLYIYTCIDLCISSAITIYAHRDAFRISNAYIVVIQITFHDHKCQVSCVYDSRSAHRYLDRMQLQTLHRIPAERVEVARRELHVIGMPIVDHVDYLPHTRYSKLGRLLC
jgi:hypothetical protein